MSSNSPQEPLNFGFSGNENWLGSSDYHNTSPIGSYPTNNSSPIGSYPTNNSSPIGSYPTNNSSPIGSYPADNFSPIGSYSPDNFSPIGSYSPDNSSPIGSYPAENYGHDTNSYSSVQPAHTQNSHRADTGMTVSPSPRRLLTGWLAATSAALVILFFFQQFWPVLPFVLQLAAGLGVYFLSQPQNRTKEMKKFLIADTVFILLQIPLCLIFPAFFHKMSVNALAMVFVSLFVIVGVGVGVYNFRTLHRLKRECTETVQGMCIDVLRRRTHSHKGGSSTVYCPVYEYFFNNERYESEYRNYSNIRVPHVGDVDTLLINPKNPYEFYEPKRDRVQGIFLYVFSFFFAGSGLFAMFNILLH